ncbi:type 2 isopentenyl-diphosphate Delta-isomerase [Lactobacillus sp. YT155]|uniref:type 2 isopentenyl-diphosphate Delta-isomerase n=1 Tax=Lactobacillus sp. YT155 TaxID=3060955 RepID=UPI00265F4334|nr:type 2 isopentenyl-diphosphate Delta-isomerase [Lactobacillus sp. YT155]MDO1605445.1 type 2 isopentenyl-diphosphate Delta-isomerase [Lactobacillus sp. YT155]
MPKQPEQLQRKNEHLFLAEKFYSDEAKNGLEQIRFINNSLPEISLSEVNYQTTFFDKTIDYPIYINAMTGGSEQSKKINERLAKLARDLHLPMAVGSMSAALKYPEVKDSYTIVRETNPDGIVIANISAKYTPQQAQKIIEMIAADALQIHLNVTQELAMAEGDRDFYWLENIKNIVNQVSVPVIVKEVGFGMSQETIAKLTKIGVKYIDISGAGGTDFVQIENARNHEVDTDFLDELKISTAESLLESQLINSEVTIFASGGIRTPLDVLKALRLGASYVGISGFILHQVYQGDHEQALTYMKKWLNNIKIASCAIGARNIKELREQPIVLSSELENYLEQRKKLEY